VFSVLTSNYQRIINVSLIDHIYTTSRIAAMACGPVARPVELWNANTNRGTLAMTMAMAMILSKQYQCERIAETWKTGKLAAIPAYRGALVGHRYPIPHRARPGLSCPAHRHRRAAAPDKTPAGPNPDKHLQSARASRTSGRKLQVFQA
jgi:hypothetical protein